VIRSSFFGSGARQKLGRALEHQLGILHAAHLMITFLAAAIVVILTLGRDFVLEGLALGTGLTLFVGIQLPRLLPPAVQVATCVSRDGRTPPAEFREALDLRPGEEHLVFFLVANVGSSHYTDCSCWIWFPPEFTLVHDHSRYAAVQYAKPFTFQEGNNCLCYVPGGHNQDVSPGNRLGFPVMLMAPQKQGMYEAHLEIDSEARWGPRHLTIVVNVGDG
jgi:hypothetical protein